MLWEEYRAANPDGFGYTWFCTTFEAWKKRVRPSMRQTHVGGEKVFVDFAGDTIDIFDPITGEARAMKLFVAAMGASNYTYAEACPSESLSDWIGVHTNLFRFLGGVPKFVVCDNLKAAVTNPDRYDPGLNRTYAEMASHYGTAILAARPRRPKDKAKVEVAVQIAQRWILARLRNQRFFSLAELNAAHDYYTDTAIAWKTVREVIAAGNFFRAKHGHRWGCLRSRRLPAARYVPRSGQRRQPDRRCRPRRFRAIQGE